MSKQLPIVDIITYGFTTYYDHFILFLKLVATLFACAVGSIAVVFLVLKPDFFIALNNVSGHFDTVVGTAYRYYTTDLSLNTQEYAQLFFHHCYTVVALMIGYLVMVCVIAAGLIRFMFEVHDTGSSAVRRLFTPSVSLVSRFVIAGLSLIGICLLSSIPIVWGFVILGPLSMGVLGVAAIIAGLWLWIRYGFMWAAMVDLNVNPLTAARISYHATSGYGWSLLALYGLAQLILLGLKITVIGALFAWPLMGLWYVRTYRMVMSYPTQSV